MDLTIALSEQPVLTEERLAEALVHTYGITAAMAAELAAAHRGRLRRCLPDDAYLATDPHAMWKRS